MKIINDLMDVIRILRAQIEQGRCRFDRSTLESVPKGRVMTDMMPTTTGPPADVAVLSSVGALSRRCN